MNYRVEVLHDGRWVSASGSFPVDYLAVEMGAQLAIENPSAHLRVVSQRDDVVQVWRPPLRCARCGRLAAECVADNNDD